MEISSPSKLPLTFVAGRDIPPLFIPLLSYAPLTMSYGLGASGSCEFSNFSRPERGQSVFLDRNVSFLTMGTSRCAWK